MVPHFTKITTFGRLPDGRTITQTTSYPDGGADYMTFLRKDRRMVNAFGIDNVRTEGICTDGLKRVVGAHAKGFKR